MSSYPITHTRQQPPLQKSKERNTTLGAQEPSPEGLLGRLCSKSAEFVRLCLAGQRPQRLGANGNQCSQNSESAVGGRGLLPRRKWLKGQRKSWSKALRDHPPLPWGLICVMSSPSFQTGRRVIACPCGSRPANIERWPNRGSPEVYCDPDTTDIPQARRLNLNFRYHITLMKSFWEAIDGPPMQLEEHSWLLTSRLSLVLRVNGRDTPKFPLGQTRVMHVTCKAKMGSPPSFGRCIVLKSPRCNSHSRRSGQQCSNRQGSIDLSEDICKVESLPDAVQAPNILEKNGNTSHNAV